MAPAVRLSEKTLELSIIAQLTQRIGISDAIWFGLTQKEECQRGYDVSSIVNGRLVVLQFKASNVLVHPHKYSNPRRRFTLPHSQLSNLQGLALRFRESVFYVFPNIGTVGELTSNSNLILQTYLLDVALLPNPFPVPHNVSQKHYAYTDPPDCEIRSEPFQAELLGLREFAEKLSVPMQNSHEMAGWLRRREFSFKGMRAYGMLLPNEV